MFDVGTLSHLILMSIYSIYCEFRSRQRNANLHTQISKQEMYSSGQSSNFGPSHSGNSFTYPNQFASITHVSNFPLQQMSANVSSGNNFPLGLKRGLPVGSNDDDKVCIILVWRQLATCTNKKLVLTAKNYVTNYGTRYLKLSFHSVKKLWHTLLVDEFIIQHSKYNINWITILSLFQENRYSTAKKVCNVKEGNAEDTRESGIDNDEDTYKSSDDGGERCDSESTSSEASEHANENSVVF